MVGKSAGRIVGYLPRWSNREARWGVGELLGGPFDLPVRGG
jgi:hypothetical protein